MNLQQQQQPELTPLQIWLMAARPKTLPAAAAPVIVGTATAFFEGGFHFPSALAALLGALLLQIGANIANDLFDFKKGADTHARLGPTRVTQAGLLTPQQVARGMWFTFALATLVGVYLVWRGGLPIVIIGITAIVSALAYTGGPYPLGYNGLGDVFVFVYFGLAAVGGTHYVQTGSLSPLAVWAAVAPGLLIVGILVVNNLRDIETDRVAGKRTLAVRFGVRGAIVEYALLMAGAYLTPLAMLMFGQGSAWMLLCWLSAPLAYRLTVQTRTLQGRALNAVLAGTGQLALLYGILFGLGLILGSG
ncbi:MAG: 1,4-dihydroxy-2-naphthoate polyprenyltransferase [Anaerolineales bacterium]